jgi:SET domain-containing protein 6
VNHGDSLEVTALRSTLPAGSEVLNYYGPLPTSELLRRYGYVTPEHHRYDVAELPWSLVRAALIEELSVSEEAIAKIEVHRWQIRARKAHRLTDTQAKLEAKEELEEYFIIERDSGEPSSEGLLTYPTQLRTVSPELAEQLKSVLKAIKNLKPEKRKREENYNAIVSKALTAKLALYSTTLEEDEKLLKSSSLGKRHRMAIEVRVGEKRLLHEALELLQGGDHEKNEAQTGKKPRHNGWGLVPSRKLAAYLSDQLQLLPPETWNTSFITHHTLRLLRRPKQIYESMLVVP